MQKQPRKHATNQNCFGHSVVGPIVVFAASSLVCGALIYNPPHPQRVYTDKTHALGVSVITWLQIHSYIATLFGPSGPTGSFECKANLCSSVRLCVQRVVAVTPQRERERGEAKLYWWLLIIDNPPSTPSEIRIIAAQLLGFPLEDSQISCSDSSASWFSFVWICRFILSRRAGCK